MTDQATPPDRQGEEARTRPAAAEDGVQPLRRGPFPAGRPQDPTPSVLHETRRQVSNSYTLLRSIIRRSAESADSIDSYAWHLEGRVDAIGSVLSAIIRDPDANFDLGELIEQELRDQRISGGRHATSLSGPAVAVGPAAVTVLTLLFHELVTNSIEHGALGMDEGAVLRVSWRIEGEAEPRLRLDWIERGAPAELAREGFGTVVLRDMLAYELDGSFSRALGAEGVAISLTLPMRNLVPGGDAATGA